MLTAAYARGEMEVNEADGAVCRGRVSRLALGRIRKDLCCDRAQLLEIAPARSADGVTELGVVDHLPGREHGNAIRLFEHVVSRSSGITVHELVHERAECVVVGGLTSWVKRIEQLLKGGLRVPRPTRTPEFDCILVLLEILNGSRSLDKGSYEYGCRVKVSLPHEFANAQCYANPLRNDLSRSHLKRRKRAEERSPANFHVNVEGRRNRSVELKDQFPAQIRLVVGKVHSQRFSILHRLTQAA